MFRSIVLEPIRNPVSATRFLGRGTRQARFSNEFLVTSVALTWALLASSSHAQLDGLYVFDGGGDSTSWNDAANWEQVLNPDGTPTSGTPATPPGPATSADIPFPGVTIDGTMPGQTALDVNLGTPAGFGSLSISGGDLTLRDLFVGRDSNGVNAGTYSMSAGTVTAGDDITVGASSAGQFQMSGGSASTGDDFFVLANSSLTMSGGTISVGDRLNLEDNATLEVNGGEISADDDFYFFGDSTVTVNGGLVQTVDKLRFDDDDTRNGKLTINGGVVRSNEFGLADIGFRGLVEIKGDGVYQVEAPTSPDDPITQLTPAQAQLLIDQGFFVTSAPAPLRLGVTSVVVPEFFGDSDVVFTQISVIPEPVSVVLFGMALAAIAAARRRV